MQYHNIPISAFPDIGAIYTISGPIYYLPPPPAALRLATVQALQLMRHCNDSGRIYMIYMKCKTLALSLLGLIHGIVWKSAASHPGPSESAGLSGPLTWIHLTSSMNDCWKGAEDISCSRAREP